MRFSGSEQNRRAAFGRRDVEFERLKKERDELLIRERAAHAEAEESREQLREVLESVGGAFFALDRQGRVTCVNDQAVSLTSWSREELLGKSVLEPFPELAEGVASAELSGQRRRGAPRSSSITPRNSTVGYPTVSTPRPPESPSIP